MTTGPMARRPPNLPVLFGAILAGSVPALAAQPPVPPPLPGRGDAERTSPTVEGLTTRPAVNPNALSGPDAPVRTAPGSRIRTDRRPDPKTPYRPATAGPDPLVILNQPEPLIPLDASVEDRNVLDTSLRVITPDYGYPTGFRVPFEHPDDPEYAVRIDGGLMLVYQDALYARHRGRMYVGMPAGAWYVIGRDDLRPHIHATPPAESDGPDLDARRVPDARISAARAAPIRLDLRVIPERPAAPAPAPASPPEPTPSADEAPAAGPRILRDDAYRRRLLRELLNRFEPTAPPVTAPAGS